MDETMQEGQITKQYEKNLGTVNVCYYEYNGGGGGVRQVSLYSSMSTHIKVTIPSMYTL